MGSGFRCSRQVSTMCQILISTFLCILVSFIPHRKTEIHLAYPVLLAAIDKNIQWQCSGGCKEKASNTSQDQKEKTQIIYSIKIRLQDKRYTTDWSREANAKNIIKMFIADMFKWAEILLHIRKSARREIILPSRRMAVGFIPNILVVQGLLLNGFTAQCNHTGQF